MPVPLRAPVGQGGPGGAGRIARGARADGVRHAGTATGPARDGRDGQRDQLPPGRAARAARRAHLRRVRSASAPPADAGGDGVDVSCMRCRGRPGRAAPLPPVLLRSRVPRLRRRRDGREGAGGAADRSAGGAALRGGDVLARLLSRQLPLEAGQRRLRHAPGARRPLRVRPVPHAVAVDEREGTARVPRRRRRAARSRLSDQGARERPHRRVARRLHDHRGLGHRRPLHRPPPL